MRILRPTLPRRTSFAHLTHAVCDAVAAKLNSRARKRLGHKTSEECYIQTRRTGASEGSVVQF